jgi:hypothetical protein
MANKSNTDSQPVLEPIDLAKGCIPGNIIVVSRKASKLMRQMSSEERQETIRQAQPRLLGTKPGQPANGPAMDNCPDKKQKDETEMKLQLVISSKKVLDYQDAYRKHICDFQHVRQSELAWVTEKIVAALSAATSRTGG